MDVSAGGRERRSRISEARRGSWSDQRPARCSMMPDSVESAKPPSPVQIRAAPPFFLGPFRSDGQQVCSTPRTRTGWWRIPAAASDLTRDLHSCVALEEPRQGGAGRLSSAPTNERTKPGRRGDRVSFQYACDRFTSPQGSRTASTGAKKSPSIASWLTLPRIIPVPQPVTCRRSWFASRFDSGLQ
jgi:hypothetical protein